MVIRLQQNSFQKNGFINVKNTVSNNVPSQLGRRTIQDVKDDMWNAKARKLASSEKKIEQKSVDFQQQRGFFSFQQDHKQNIENLKNVNRWK